MHDRLRTGVGSWVDSAMVDYSSSTPRKSHAGLIALALVVVALASTLAVVACQG